MRAAVTCALAVLAGAIPAQTLVSDLRPGPAAASPDALCAYGPWLLFAANDGTHGRELWRSDGTAAGTRLVRDLHVGGADSAPDELTVLGDHVWFSADDGVHGRELWRTDGTAAGTQMLRDLRPGAAASDPRHLTTYQGRLWFVADDGVHGRELWSSDGSAAGTGMLADLGSDAQAAVQRMQPAGGLLYLVYFDPTTYPAHHLLRTDGTAPNTVPLGAAYHVIDELTDVDGVLFAVFGHGLDGGYRADLVRSDGAGVTVLRTFAHGRYRRGPWGLTAWSHQLVFGAYEVTAGGRLWRSDGAAAGTIPIHSGTPYELAAGADAVLFSLDDGVHGRELWRTDGSLATFVADMRPGAAASDPAALTATGLGTRLLLTADDGNHGREVWVTDGTAAGTRQLADIAAGAAGSDPGCFVRVDTTVFFAADDGSHGRELHALPLRATGESALAPFGVGCPGGGGVVPSIAAQGAPVLGNAGLRIDLAGARPGSWAALGLATRWAAPPYAACTPMLAGAFGTATVAIDGTGAASLALPVPSTPHLLGAGFALQYAVLDPQGALAGLLALSPGLWLAVGE